MIVDIAPLLNALISVAATVVLALGSVAVHRFNTWLAAKTGQQNLINEDQVRTTLHQALDNGVAYATTKIGSADWSRPGIKSALVAEAISYATTHAPDAVAHFQLDEPKLEQLVLAKLPQVKT
jgi:hypothetical protein